MSNFFFENARFVDNPGSEPLDAHEMAFRADRFKMALGWRSERSLKLDPGEEEGILVFENKVDVVGSSVDA